MIDLVLHVMIRCSFKNAAFTQAADNSRKVEAGGRNTRKGMRTVVPLRGNRA